MSGGDYRDMRELKTRCPHTRMEKRAKAMKERLASVIGLAGYDVEVGTFHSFANALIQESDEAANYIGDKVQLDEVERMRAMEHILDNTDGLDEIRPFRAPYTYGFILGFQRLVWWPKCTPASSRSSTLRRRSRM